MLRRDRLPTAAARAPAGPDNAGFRITDYPFYLLARVGALYARRLERALKPRGMDQPGWRVLMILNEYDGASMGLVAELAVMKLPTLLKVVRRMEQAGLLESAPRASDQRVVDLRLSRRGRAELRFVKRAAARVYGEATHRLGSGALRQLNTVLCGLEANLLRAERGPDGAAASRRRRA